MQEKDLRELIDRYLLGTINADEEAQLSDLRKTNPEVDLRVQQSMEAFRVLQYGRYQQIRQSLKQIDALDTKTPNRYRYKRWIIMSVIFVFSLLGIWLWLVIHYSPSSLANRFFQPASDEFFSIHKINQEEIIAWKLAEKAFVNGDYLSAISSFESFTANEEYLISTQAQWNILLARFAGDDAGKNWKSDIIEFEKGSPEHLKGQAQRLLRVIDSPFYRILIFELPKQLSALKPQIM